MEVAIVEEILQSEAVEALVGLKEFRAGAMHTEWRDNHTRYVVYSYKDEIAWFDGEWHLHWLFNASVTTLRHTRIADRAARDAAYRSLQGR